jgi:hypothetical protein
LPPTSPGESKLGADTKANTPVAALMVNLEASAPPLIAKVFVAPASGSVDITVVTAVLFSVTLTAAEAPPPFEVIVGASFWLVTVTAIA